jgi:predicted metal-dependent phosphotriesterase family hydrolase
MGRSYAAQRIPAREASKPAGATMPPPYDPRFYLLISTLAVPALRADGVSEEVIDTMLCDVPRRFLTGEGLS